MKLVFATNNKHKISEVKKLLPDSVEVLTLSDIGCTDELPETGNTLEKNAMQKARYIYDKYGMDCFADDSGLETEALGGRPGVYSARYAGRGATDAENVKKLLAELQGENNRKARFRTVIALMIGESSRYFEGEIKGTITLSEKGTNGFGYDPVFVPDGYEQTFAEMSAEEKNRISHRATAVRNFTDYLNEVMKGKSK